MVCHETYKDKNNNWISPDEIISIEGKKFLKQDKKEQIKVGPSESMSKSKRNDKFFITFSFLLVSKVFEILFNIKNLLIF